MAIPRLRRYFERALLLSLAGIALVVGAALGGWFDEPAPPPVPSEGGSQRPRMQGVHVYEDLGGAVTLHLTASTIEPAPGKLGRFVSWLKPIVAVRDARVVVAGPAGERVTITGRECSLSPDGRTITFTRRVLWQRTDLGQTYVCRRLSLNLDDQGVAFDEGLRRVRPDMTAWPPFQIHGIFSPFPPAAAAAGVEKHGTAPITENRKTSLFAATSIGGHPERIPHNPPH